MMTVLIIRVLWIISGMMASDLPCSVGRYRTNDFVQSFCNTCPRGQLVDEARTGCTLRCRPGHFAGAASLERHGEPSACLACPRGKFRASRMHHHSRPGSWRQQLYCWSCAVGRFDNGTAASDSLSRCQPCPPGRAVSVTGAFRCRRCIRPTATHGRMARPELVRAAGRARCDTNAAHVVVSSNVSRRPRTPAKLRERATRACPLGYYQNVVSAASKSPSATDAAQRCSRCPTGQLSAWPWPDSIHSADGNGCISTQPFHAERATASPTPAPEAAEEAAIDAAIGTSRSRAAQDAITDGNADALLGAPPLPHEVAVALRNARRMLCPPGSFPSRASQACAPCPPGHHWVPPARNTLALEAAAAAAGARATAAADIQTSTSEAATAAGRAAAAAVAAARGTDTAIVHAAAESAFAAVLSKDGQFASRAAARASRLAAAVARATYAWYTVSGAGTLGMIETEHVNASIDQGRNCVPCEVGKYADAPGVGRMRRDCVACDTLWHGGGTGGRMGAIECSHRDDAGRHDSSKHQERITAMKMRDTEAAMARHEHVWRHWATSHCPTLVIEHVAVHETGNIPRYHCEMAMLAGIYSLAVAPFSFQLVAVAPPTSSETLACSSDDQAKGNIYAWFEHNSNGSESSTGHWRIGQREADTSFLRSADIHIPTSSPFPHWGWRFPEKFRTPPSGIWRWIRPSRSHGIDNHVRLQVQCVQVALKKSLPAELRAQVLQVAPRSPSVTKISTTTAAEIRTANTIGKLSELLSTLPPNFFDSAQRSRAKVSRSVSMPQSRVNMHATPQGKTHWASIPRIVLTSCAVVLVVVSMLFAHKRQDVCYAQRSFRGYPDNGTAAEHGHLVHSCRDTEADEGEGQFRFDPSQFTSL